jgi:acyl carrier protein
MVPQQLPSFDRLMRPYDRRAGSVNFGEGSATLILESREHAARRGAAGYALMLSAAMARDGLAHPLASDETGIGLVTAVRRCLGSRWSIRDVAYVHGASDGDAMVTAFECNAIRQLYGPAAGGLLMTSQEACFGHNGAPAGCLGVGLTALMMRRGEVCPTTNCEDPADGLPFDPVPGTKARPLDFGYALNLDRAPMRPPTRGLTPSPPGGPPAGCRPWRSTGDPGDRPVPPPTSPLPAAIRPSRPRTGCGRWAPCWPTGGRAPGSCLGRRTAGFPSRPGPARCCAGWPAVPRRARSRVPGRPARGPAWPRRPRGWPGRNALESYLAGQVRAVLGLGQRILDPDTVLRSLGFDSLLSIELSCRLESGLAIKLGPRFVPAHPTLAELTDAIAERLDADLAGGHGS